MAKYPVDYVTRLAKAIAAASRALASADDEEGSVWRGLLSIERAWPLAALLAFWYLLQTNRDPEYRVAIKSLADDSRSSTPAGDFYGIWRYFDMYKALLSRPAELAYEAKNANDVALASGAFKYAARQIGAAPLSMALQSSLFVAVSERLRQVLPAPSGEGSAMEAGSKPSQQRTSRSAAAGRFDLTAAPALSEQDRCVLLLVSRGHSQKQAEQICRGPARVASRPSASAKGKKV